MALSLVDTRKGRLAIFSKLLGNRLLLVLFIIFHFKKKSNKKKTPLNDKLTSGVLHEGLTIKVRSVLFYLKDRDMILIKTAMK